MNRLLFRLNRDSLYIGLYGRMRFLKRVVVVVFCRNQTSMEHLQIFRILRFFRMSFPFYPIK